MNIDLNSIVLVRIGEQRVRARVVEFINNNNVIVYLLNHSLHGERTILVSLSDITVLDNLPTIDNSVNIINQIIPTQLSSEPEYVGYTNIRRRGGRRSRNMRLKHKRSYHN